MLPISQFTQLQLLLCGQRREHHCWGNEGAGKDRTEIKRFKPYFGYLLFLIKRILNNLQQQYLFSYLDQKQHETQFQNISCDLATRHYLTNFTLASHWHGAKSGPVLVSQQWGGWGSTSWTKTTQSCFRWSDQQTAMLWPPFVNRMAFLRICSFGNFMLKPSWVHIT